MDTVLIEANTMIAKSPYFKPSSPVSKWVVFGLAFAPSLYYLERGISGQFGADPLGNLQGALTSWAIVLLLAGLGLGFATGFLKKHVAPYRRPLKLAAYATIAMILAIYLLLDRQLDMALIGSDIANLPYRTMIMVAMLLTIPQLLVWLVRLFRRQKREVQ